MFRACRLRSDSWQTVAHAGELHADLLAAGCEVRSRDDVMEGVSEMIDETRVGATFSDGTKLVTLYQPIP